LIFIVFIRLLVKMLVELKRNQKLEILFIVFLVLVIIFFIQPFSFIKNFYKKFIITEMLINLKNQKNIIIELIC